MLKDMCKFCDAHQGQILRLDFGSVLVFVLLVAAPKGVDWISDLGFRVFGFSIWYVEFEFGFRFLGCFF